MMSGPITRMLMVMIIITTATLCLGLAVSGPTGRDPTAIVDPMRREAIDRFLKSRRDMSLWCLYAFDRVLPPSNVSAVTAAAVSEGVPARTMVTMPPAFEELMGPASCPFGHLQFDPALVTGLDGQLGARLTEDPAGDTRRLQIVSTDVTAARPLFAGAMTNGSGLTLELAFRRRVEANQTMTLVSIGNEFDGCADPGFRLELDRRHGLVLIYFFPFQEGTMEACYEQRLYSTHGDRGPCVMPPWRARLEDNPVVHVTVTIDTTGGLGSWHSMFYVKYVDPVTMETVKCHTRVTQKNPTAFVFDDEIRGTYRLFVGNNPRNVSFPRPRPVLAMVREYQSPDGPGFDELPPEEQLRQTLKKKLDSIRGPRLPKAMRFSGSKQVSLKLFGLQINPFNEDTPLKWIRNQIEEFKAEHGDDIVEFLMNSLKKGKSAIDSPFSLLNTSRKREGGVTEAPKEYLMYPNANGSTFDVFHLAIYKKALSADEVERNLDGWLTPRRPFPAATQKIHLAEDQTILLDLLSLHSVFDDVVVDLVELPQRGELLSYPDMTPIAEKTMRHFTDLPPEHRQHVYFKPKLHENNDNMDIGWGWDGARRMKPYGVVKYRVNRSSSGRSINTSIVASIELFVDPVVSAPRPREDEMVLSVTANTPLFINLGGLDVDAGILTTNTTNRVAFDSTLPRALSLLDDLLGEDTLDLPTDMNGDDTDDLQYLEIIEFPRYGRLYERRSETMAKRLTWSQMLNATDFEEYRIHREIAPDRMHSTDLIYVYSGINGTTTGKLVDSLTYRLRKGKRGNASVAAHVLFRFAENESLDSPSYETFVGTIEVKEDAIAVISLLDLEPLVGSLPSIPRFRIVREPRRGRLYQLHQSLHLDSRDSRAGEESNASMPVGKRLTNEGNLATVEDTRGRVVYIPEVDYFNTWNDDSKGEFDFTDHPLDDFAFEVVADVKPSDIPTDISIDVEQPRVVRIQVTNQPDFLTILPPTVINTDKGRNEDVHVPVRFYDPDGFFGDYVVRLEAGSDGQEFELGHAITDNDVLKYCTMERPCEIARSTNASFQSNENGDDHEIEDRKVRFVIHDIVWDPTTIELRGSKKAIESALLNLKFRDTSIMSWREGHTAKFEVSIQRKDSRFNAAIKATFYVEFAPSAASSMAQSVFGGLLSKLWNLLTMAVCVVTVCLLLTSASCCSTGFCCCCGGRARGRKRAELEQKHRQYVEQVVQNDHEYSLLMEEVIDVLLKPSLTSSVCLLRSCSKMSDRSFEAALCWESLMPLLESERQTVRFIVKMARMEFMDMEHARDARSLLGSPSPAGFVLAHFCCQVGELWFSNATSVIIESQDSGSITSSELILSIEKYLHSIPVELVILCNSVARLMESAGCSSNWSQIDYLHVVFFNHFIGPMLWFSRWNRGANWSKTLRCRLREIAIELFMTPVSASTTSQWLEGEQEATCGLYRRLLERILHADGLKQSFVPAPSHNVDSELMGMCAMNVHSILESSWVQLEREHLLFENHSLSEATCLFDDYDKPLDRLRRVLRAANFPAASTEELVAMGSAQLAKETMLFEGFSAHEWDARIRAFQVKRQTPTLAPMQSIERCPQRNNIKTLRRAGSLLVVDIIPENPTDFHMFRPPSARPRQEPHPEFEF